MTRGDQKEPDLKSKTWRMRLVETRDQGLKSICGARGFFSSSREVLNGMGNSSKHGKLPLTMTKLNMDWRPVRRLRRREARTAELWEWRSATAKDREGRWEERTNGGGENEASTANFERGRSERKTDTKNWKKGRRQVGWTRQQRWSRMAARREEVWRVRREFRGGGGRMAKKISSGEGIRVPAVAMVGSPLLNFKSPLRYPIFHYLSQFGS